MTEAFSPNALKVLDRLGIRDKLRDQLRTYVTKAARYNAAIMQIARGERRTDPEIFAEIEDLSIVMAAPGLGKTHVAVELAEELWVACRCCTLAPLTSRSIT